MTIHERLESGPRESMALAVNAKRMQPGPLHMQCIFLVKRTQALEPFTEFATCFRVAGVGDDGRLTLDGFVGPLPWFHEGSQGFQRVVFKGIC